MDTIPDGTYSTRSMHEVAITGDRGTFPFQSTVRKSGRELVFDNAGTALQSGSMSVAFAAWRGAILGSIDVLMLPDQLGCVGGAVREVDPIAAFSRSGTHPWCPAHRLRASPGPQAASLTRRGRPDVA